jgi:glycosyltransferase involved in cell wall biosynthesis
LKIPIGENEEREPNIISLGQFRPEKEQKLQIEIFKEVQKQFPKACLVLLILLLNFLVYYWKLQR